jgi:predicted DsbA family dithiol-disulfide isomerase
MKVEIWSDVMCPFCYIGKRRFESALQQTSFKDNIEVEWKSFQLDPSIQNEPGKRINEYLAERKGFSIEKAKELNGQVTKMAAAEGLQYDFDKAVVANSFDAHRFSHLAAKHGKGDAAEESLFKAYFTEGKNIADHDTLVQLGTAIGLDGTEVKQVLGTDAYTAEVEYDINEAQQLGVQGVPFFVLDRKYAVSGAQSAETFVQALEKAYTEWKQENGLTNLGEGEVCTPGGDCN